MKLHDARLAIAGLLEDTLNLTPGRTLFAGRFPPGVRTGVTFAFTGIRRWNPDAAMECEAEIHGISASEEELSEILAALRELLQSDHASGVLAWQLAGPVKLSVLPGVPADRYEFVMPLAVSFV